MRRLLLPLGALALAFGLTGCDVSLTPYAARVGATTITSGDLNSTLHAIASNTGLRCEIQAGSTTAGAIEGSGSDTFDSEFAASKLSFLIDARLMQGAVAKLGLASTPLARSLARRPARSRAAHAASGSSVQRRPARRCWPRSRRRCAPCCSAIEDQTEDILSAYLAGYPLTPSAVAAYGAAHQGTTDLRCVSAILTQTKATADSIHAALVSGGDFATLAKADSADPTSAANGGALGCHQTNEFTSPLDTAVAGLAVGALSPVITFSGEFVIVKVTALQAATSAEVAEAIISAGQSAEASYVNKLGGSTKIAVDPVYGSWQKSSGTWMVTPRAGPGDNLLGNAAAVTPPTLAASSG